MDWLATAYSVSGLVFGAAFIPQIMTLVKDKSAVACINISTWALFSLCSAVNLLYAMVHNGDAYFIFCSLIGVLGNMAILCLACYHRLPVPVYVRASVSSSRPYLLVVSCIAALVYFTPISSL